MADYDLIVIGAGAGGLGAARAAKRGGKRVALIEAEKTGGDCTYYGCVPSKSLIESAKRVHHARTGAAYGFTASVEVDFAAVMRRVQATITAISEDESPAQLAREGVDLVMGTASFTDPHTISVDGRRLSATAFVIATGGGPFVPPLPGLDETPYVTNRTVFELTAQPEHLLVMGGGPIGCELAQAFARLGSRVTVIQEGHILPRDEPEVVDVLTAAFRRDGVTLRTGSKVASVAKDGAGVSVTLADGATLNGSDLLVATGRRPSTDALELDRAGVRRTKTGHVEVDDTLRTTASHIYAIGDCAARYQFTHLADEQGRHAAGNAFRRRPKKFARVLPWTTFTSPEVAHVGMTEAEAFAEYGDKAMVSTLQLTGVDRARCAGETEGFVKVVVAPRGPLPIIAGKVVGATIVAPVAGELLSEFVLAMETGSFVGRIAQTIHAYPTWSMANRQAVALFLGETFYGEAARPARPPADVTRRASA